MCCRGPSWWGLDQLCKPTGEKSWVWVSNMRTERSSCWAVLSLSTCATYFCWICDFLCVAASHGYRCGRQHANMEYRERSYLKNLKCKWFICKIQEVGRGRTTQFSLKCRAMWISWKKKNETWHWIFWSQKNIQGILNQEQKMKFIVFAFYL